MKATISNRQSCNYYVKYCHVHTRVTQLPINLNANLILSSKQ